MKWTLLLAFTLALAAGCKKSAAPDEDAGIKSELTDPAEGNALTGTWKLVEYFQDRGDGTGYWAGAADPDQVTFTASGELKVSANSPLANRGFNCYKIVDKNHVELYSTTSANKDSYYYDRESDSSLLFNPQCRENCSRRYQLVNP